MNVEFKLLKEIEECRNEMNRLAKSHSLTSERVVYVSAKLDFLLNEYETLKQKHQQPTLGKVSC
ncbi:aspartyl-phosphate phosphatase Spo0E family protein [Halobacillus sp. A1]|uniref:Spo0E family sporulation regulatory protein-aspartic acid phosphatase n=1 Tax=Halobacillus campisalis TaxID=435909 RepID=A0ABW2K430_9BACI|nr:MULTISPECIES: aspartyl-phosphate phosphatase Spo0E family protein [Halobacillus]MCP3031714.1 aspartyl-phosphate phosphatase Spo0E family protein [Halobacillus sp. A1]